MKWHSTVITAFALIMCFGCSDARSDYDDSENEDSISISEDPESSTEVDEDENIPDPAADAEGLAEFHGYECTQDCSGHEAGYSWAEDKGILDPDDCGGSSQSFEEGCRAYAEEQ